MLKHSEIEQNIGLIAPYNTHNYKGVKYINMACGFDIETTSDLHEGHKVAHAYIWMLGIGHDNPIYYGRTWEELQITLDVVVLGLGVNIENRLVIYVHNLGYEFQFMHKYFIWDSIFAVDERRPIKAVTTSGVEFRDSYILSGLSLENTSKNLTKYRVPKLVGALDYSLKRNHKTQLSSEEMSYCENDVRVVTAYIQEQIELYGDVTKIPMTNTGRVRKYVKDACFFTSKNHRKSSKGKFYRYRNLMGDLTLTPAIYTQMKRAFMGGFTHSNANHSGKTLRDVTSLDFTSSYPSVMVAEKFPMSRFKPIEVRDSDHFNFLCSKFALLFDIKLTDVTTKITQETYISESKCWKLSNPIINNGRVASADELTTTITEVDFTIIKQVYSWESIEIANVHYAHMNYLPKPIVSSILKLYGDKTTLKDVEGFEAEYLLSKGMLNSVYGMSVTDVVKKETTYEDGEWGFEVPDLEVEVTSYNESKNRFLYYPWGLWVTAYARRNLWTGILAVGDDYIYSDTDSLKMFNYKNHLSYVEWFNANIIEKMRASCLHHNLDTKLLNPKNSKGVSKMLGVWDYEGTYSRFKTLGAKRYLVEDSGQLFLTVAGLSKQNGINYMLEMCEGDVEEVFRMFDDTLHIPANKTGKMTHTYIDEEIKYISRDYLGNSAIVNPLSGVHLEPCEFTLSISEQYKLFIKQLASGYIYKGVKHV